MIEQHYKEFDVALDRLFAKAREEGLVIPCKRGCDACCYDAAIATHLEMPPLIELLRTMSPEVRAAIEVRIRAWFDAMQAGGVDPLGSEPDLELYHRVHAPCPLLDLEKHECRVYDVRPVACRAHHLVGDTAAPCANRVNEPSLPMIDMNQMTVPMFRRLVLDQAEQHDGDFTITTALLAAMLAAVWPLVENAKVSIADWLVRASREGVKLRPLSKEQPSAE